MSQQTGHTISIVFTLKKYIVRTYGINVQIQVKHIFEQMFP